ncbi:GNAT family N-acetyltransferase [Aureimonas leprariae]|uniref:GNAT family N-acetyltransferase n=1 Tax=Plantimonas leprariae TaxID=2615207 RepID=UPI00192A3003|nr:GNAT family N-acetyltransferase [Aureimonas leprariae]
MTEAVVIRPLAAGDREAWLPLWRGYLEFYRATIADDGTALTWQRLLDPSEPMTAFGAFDDRGLFGIAHAILHRSTWTAGDYCYLQDLFVAPDRRGTGAGAALIEAVCEFAKREGASRVHWLTHETNETARRLYDKVAERSGFIQYRRML